MSLRKSYAAVLQLLRITKGLSQQEVAGKGVQSHVSQIENAKTTATIDVTCELAAALKIHPTAFLALILASQEQRTARDVLSAALADIEELGLADQTLPKTPKRLVAPRVEEAVRKREAVQDLKAKGLTQAEAAKILDIPEATLRRLWHQSASE